MVKLKKKKPIEEESEYEEDDEEVEEETEEAVIEEPTVKSKAVIASGDWTVGEVATATQPVIYHSKTNARHTTETALAEILNKLEKIEKSVVG